MMLKNRITLISLFFTVFQLGFSQSKGDKLFDATSMHELRIYSDSEPDLFTLIQNEALVSFDRPNHLVKMEFDGEVLDSVAIRAKGTSSSTIPQTPLKIDINEYISSQSFDGIKKFNLTNSYLDPYRQRDRICYELFRCAGVPSPRTAYTELYINDEFINIYLLVEQIDKTFIMENFADKGSLNKFDSGLIYGPDMFGNIVTIREKLNQRHFYKFLLTNYIVRGQDNYPFNNFYTYYSEKADSYYFLPWDYNLSLDADWTNGASSIKPTWGAPSIWETAELKSVYLEIACELNDYLFDEIESLLQDNEDIILSNSHGATVKSHLTLLSYLIERKQWLEEELAIAGANCIPLLFPLEIGDLVINEFVSTSDSIGGVQEPNGGTPDWIELYNNTDQDIELNHHYYLTDDVDFPKKWNFETPVIIPANGYQIIWADRDIHQQGVHSNFKIAKSGGDLMLVYEDLTVIDQLSYETQDLNKGYARVPNGVGEFIIQDHTFDSNNDLVSSISSSDKTVSISIYPNPAQHVVNIISSEPITKTTLYAYNGCKIEEQKNEDKFATIDVSQVLSGLYFVHIQTNNHHEVIKFTKE